MCISVFCLGFVQRSDERVRLSCKWVWRRQAVHLTHICDGLDLVQFATHKCLMFSPPVFYYTLVVRADLSTRQSPRRICTIREAIAPPDGSTWRRSRKLCPEGRRDHHWLIFFGFVFLQGAGAAFKIPEGLLPDLPPATVHQPPSAASLPSPVDVLPAGPVLVSSATAPPRSDTVCARSAIGTSWMVDCVENQGFVNGGIVKIVGNRQMARESTFASSVDIKNEESGPVWPLACTHCCAVVCAPFGRLH